MCAAILLLCCRWERWRPPHSAAFSSATFWPWMPRCRPTLRLSARLGSPSARGESWAQQWTPSPLLVKLTFHCTSRAFLLRCRVCGVCLKYRNIIGNAPQSVCVEARVWFLKHLKFPIWYLLLYWVCVCVNARQIWCVGMQECWAWAPASSPAHTMCPPGCPSCSWTSASTWTTLSP